MTTLAAVFLHAVLVGTALAQASSFEVRASPGVSEPARAHVADLVGRGLERLSPRFRNRTPRAFTVWVHRNVESVPERIRASLHEGTAGLALLGRDEIHVILEQAQELPPHDLRTVVEHELVHLLLDQSTGAAAPFVSRWFHEGLAQELSGGAYIGMSEEDLIAAANWDRLLRFSDLDEDFPHDRSELRRAYAQSFSFVGFLHRKLGLDELLEAARRSTADDGTRAGLVSITGMPLLQLEDEWRDDLLSSSGAAMRLVLRNCFDYMMVGAFVLLALAGIRRWRRDSIVRAKLEREEAEETDSAP